MKISPGRLATSQAVSVWTIPPVSVSLHLGPPALTEPSDDPVFRYSGGEDNLMTPYLCLENCMGQQLHQRYDKNLVVGITQGTMCLCGYDYELKKAAARK